MRSQNKHMNQEKVHKLIKKKKNPTRAIETLGFGIDLVNDDHK